MAVVVCVVICWLHRWHGHIGGGGVGACRMRRKVATRFKRMTTCGSRLAVGSAMVKTIVRLARSEGEAMVSAMARVRRWM